jgi:hypothetical protein
MTRPTYWILLLATVGSAEACGGGSSALSCQSGEFYRDGQPFDSCDQCPSSDCGFESDTTDLCTYSNGIQQCTTSGTVTVHCGSERATVDIVDDVWSCGGGGGGGSSGSAGSAMPGTGATGGAAGAGGSAGASDIFANCTFPTTGIAPTVGTAPTRNNSADLSGPVVGNIPFDPSTMRRTLPVNVETAPEGLHVGAAYLTRTDSSETAYLTIPVTNSGSSEYCFIEANPLQYLSGDGTSLTDPTHLTFLEGSVGLLSFGGGYTDTCLAPGESGYLIDIQLSSDGPFFSDTASIQLALSSSSTGTVPGAALVPQSYDIGTCSGLRSLRVTSLDTGTSTATVDDTVVPSEPAIFLDEQALPSGWTFVENDQPETVLSGGTVSSFAIVSATPAVTRAQFFIGFGPPTVASTTTNSVATKLQQVRSRRLDLAARWRAAAGRISPSLPRP